MRVLFVISDVFMSEPLGSMQLSAVCKQKGHSTRFMALKHHDIVDQLNEYQPDLVAYSTMTPDAHLFASADQRVKQWKKDNRSSLVRIMGGPHATFFPEILDACALDGVCIGEGDRAIAAVLDRVEAGKPLDGIPNIITLADKTHRKELITDLDSLPFVDRDVYYEAFPRYRAVGLRSISASRGCPYHCTYCHNHRFNEIFKGCGPVVRRRSPELVIKELQEVIQKFQPVAFFRFADDTLTHKVDPWFEDLLGRYRRDIHVPFYCLMRSNTLTEDAAKLLSDSGCRSIAMSVETGGEKARNEILKRNLADDMVRNSYKIARKYKLATYANTMLGLPGTTLKDDFYSFRFSRSLGITVPLFGIFCPYPRTELAQYAIDNGMLDAETDVCIKPTNTSVLNCYTVKEKNIQRRLSYLAPVFSLLPAWFDGMLNVLVRLPFDRLYVFISAVCVSYRTSRKVFPGIYPRSLKNLIMVARDAVRLLTQRRGK
ncbi:MAG: radical SAM protein [bacterium]